ncbi:MAG: 16S rRNA (cytosine(1402)-N(4))-methyltransferase RsmH [Cyanobacteria bacterium NC_groundwater_1444_Ag_S-0.65um_54_12]|nr:16S rRNA (cytosine(1402)-N(4))-methyltransferase RsmH [Cyanobacteria bacterium NC_groundwater_1444_Ag_S-0.65um_54_12]
MTDILPASSLHNPVMLTQVLTLLVPRPGMAIFDGTIGLGGHAATLLASITPDGVLYGADRDADSLALAEAHLRLVGGNFVLFHDTYDRALQRPDLPGLDGILLDLGLSSWQLACTERGFSFARSGPLDMRMDPTSGLSAQEIVNTWSEDALTQLFARHGEEPNARKVARAIIPRRPIYTTGELAAIASQYAARNPSGAHRATRIFQAVRIAVNDELGCLSRGLPAAVAKLKPEGRLAVISFHSLEDRIVKRFIRSEAKGCICPSRVPICICGQQPRLRDLSSKPLVPGAEEVHFNPRSRSAKLRGAQRI